jgi:hypothetical protein
VRTVFKAARAAFLAGETLEAMFLFADSEIPFGRCFMEDAETEGETSLPVPSQAQEERNVHCG